MNTYQNVYIIKIVEKLEQLTYIHSLHTVYHKITVYNFFIGKSNIIFYNSFFIIIKQYACTVN